LAPPITRRPLFPGFYKAVVVLNPGIVAAIKEMMKRGQPYPGAFLLEEENTDSDVISDISSVHEVGVFAQITSVFAAVGRGEDDREEGLTAVLYPHRRIKITELVKPGPAKPPQVKPQSVEPPSPSPSPPPDRQVAEKSGTFRLLFVSSLHSNYTQDPVQTAFLHKHDISIVNVDLITLPYNKDDQYIRAFMFEIVSVFKDIAQLNPLFRDQITTFLSTKLPPTFSMYQTNLPILQLLYPPVKFKNFKMSGIPHCRQPSSQSSPHPEKKNSSTLNSKVNYLETWTVKSPNDNVNIALLVWNNSRRSRKSWARPFSAAFAAYSQSPTSPTTRFQSPPFISGQ
jgi:ATP-dependent protease La (Lon)-like substrate-binding protein